MANLSNINNKFLVTTGGNVGINTTSPGRKLTVTGDASGDANNLLLSNENDANGDSASIGFSMLSNNTYVKSGIFFERTTTQGRGSLHLAVNNEVNGNNVTKSDAKITISNTGNVGIGTTTIPADHILQISNAGQSYARVALTNSQTGNASGDGLIFQMENLNSIIKNQENGFLGFGTNGRESDIRIDSSGNVGIGTNSPTSPAGVGRFLHISGSPTAGIVISDSDNANYNWDIWNSGGGLNFRYNNDANIGFGIDSSGNTTFAGNLTIGAGTSTRLVTTLTENSKVNLNVVDGTSTARALTFSTGNTERVIIDANGSIYNNSATGQSFWGSNNAGNPSSVTGTSNSSFGYGAGNALTTGYQNVNIGRDSGGSLTTGLNNVSVGTNAGASNVDGQQNTYVGTAAGYASPGQNYNTFVGYESGHYNTANENTALGRLSLHSNTTGSYNTAIGMQALANNTTQNNLTALGYRAGYFWTGGNENTFIGYNAGFSSAGASSGGENTLVGSLAGANTSAITGTGNTSIGRYTLFGLTSGSYNTALGHQAGAVISTGNANTVVGKNAGDSIGSGSRNSTLGQSSGQGITIGSDNIAIGYEAMFTNVGGGQNVAIGVNAARDFTGSRLVAIGTNAAKQLTSDVDNVFIGQDCGHHRLSGVDNTFVGSYANYNGNATGCCNTGFGKSTGYELTSGVQNTFIGRQAGYSVTTADNNTMVGHNAGIYATGGQNTLIGSGAGDAITTGNHNNIFGYNCEASSVGGTDQIVIGTNGQVGKGNSTGFISPGTGGVYQGNNSTTWSTTSDKRIKKNIVDNNKGLEIINKIQVRNFEYRTEEEIIDFENPKSAVVNQEGIQLGVIAQEIEKVLPEVVTEESTGVKRVNADNLTWYLINAVKELKAEVDLLKAEIEELKK